MRAWESLPNAKHIDAILADLQHRPLAWAKAWRKLVESELEESEMVASQRADERASARQAAIAAAEASSRSDILVKAERAVRVAEMADELGIASNMAAQVVARDAVRALIAWDDCAYMLDLEVASLRRLIASYGVGLPQAALLLPAVIAVSTPA